LWVVLVIEWMWCKQAGFRVGVPGVDQTEGRLGVLEDVKRLGRW
jgi:hypothetical protein